MFLVFLIIHCSLVSCGTKCIQFREAFVTYWHTHVCLCIQKHVFFSHTHSSHAPCLHKLHISALCIHTGCRICISTICSVQCSAGHSWTNTSHHTICAECTCTWLSYTIFLCNLLYTKKKTMENIMKTRAIVKIATTTARATMMEFEAVSVVGFTSSPVSGFCIS